MATAAIPTSQNSPQYRLFDSSAVSLAALLGGPIAGASLMAMNYSRLGQARNASIALVVGIPIGALLLLALWKSPSAAASPLALVALIAVSRSARWLQGRAVQQHVEVGGKLVSRWASFGLGLTFFILMLGTIYAASFWEDQQTKIIVGTRDSVYFTGSATRQEAVALGNLLKINGYFTNRGVDVLISRDASGMVLSFITKEGSWGDPELVSSFNELGREAAPVLGGFPLRLRLLNNAKNIERESVVGKLALPGNDAIYYFGDATLAQAQKLADVLVSQGYLRRQAASVFLTDNNHALTLAFIVEDGVADDPGVLQRYEGIVHTVAPLLGRLPIELKLLSPALLIQRQESIS